MLLPGYYTGEDTYTRLSYKGPTVVSAPGSVGDYVPNISGLAALGQDPYAIQELSEMQTQSDDSGVGYFVLRSLASAIAGSIVGYMASGGKQSGALIGGAVLGGVTGLSDSIAFATEGKTEISLVTGFMSLTSIAGAFYAFNDIKGNRPAKTLF
jgi:hypothetical protein